MDGIKTLLQAIQHFSDEKVCIDTFAKMRWIDGKPICPRCDTKETDERKHYWLETQKRWKCYGCRKQFSVKQGSVFEDSAIPLSKWFPALWSLLKCKNGISSYELASDLGVTQKTAWFMLHRLRLVLKTLNDDFKFGGGPGGKGSESDEMYIGGNPQKMHKDRRQRVYAAFHALPKHKRGNYPAKTPVMGIFDRETRKVRAKVVPNVKRETLQNEILANVHLGSPLYTDDASAYHTLKDKFVHETVNHIDKYVRDQVHTNCLENFWSLTKRTLKGTYVATEPYHLDAYLDEQMFRFNNRRTKDNPLDDSDRFLLALSQAANRRMTWKALTGKEAARPA